MREWLRILFQRDGFEVLIADDGLTAREIVAREFVDVVLTDIRMPRLDGVRLLQAVRELAPDAVVLMMTAHWTRDSDEWKHARELGAEALFEKPFRDVHLVTMQVRQLLESRRLRHENVVLRQHDRGSGLRRHHRPQHADAGRLPPGRDGLPHQQHHPHHRRVGHRQGTGRAGHAQAVAAPRQAVRRRQLRRDAREPARVRAVRPCPRAPSPEPTRTRRASSRWPRAAPCSSTRLAR